jgi:pilus assembly protein Flp/PilA
MKDKIFSATSQATRTMIEYLHNFIGGNLSIKSQKGVTLIEYSLIASLVAVVAITALTSVGTKLTDIFTYVAGKLTHP